jgi:predicted nucleic acid-binding protein
VATDFLVLNTGPLILLEKAQALDLIGKLPFEFVCPAAVRRELDAGIPKGFPDVRPQWLQVINLQAPLSPLTRATLDEGEAEVFNWQSSADTNMSG